jgi:uncharacterized protein YdbL (DUF1318 family)
VSVRIRSLAAALALGLAAAAPASALDLDQARAEGLVGEQADGYVGLVQDTPDARALVARINSERAAAYAEIARKNGTSTDAVAALTAQRVVARLPKGSWVKDSTGSWIRK